MLQVLKLKHRKYANRTGITRMVLVLIALILFSNSVSLAEQPSVFSWALPSASDPGTEFIPVILGLYRQRSDDNQPASLSQFVRDLIGILLAQTSFEVNDLKLTDAFRSNNHWIRLLLIDVSDNLALMTLLYMDGPDPHAFVNEIHVINEVYYISSMASDLGYDISIAKSHRRFAELSSACALAAEGLDDSSFAALVGNSEPVPDMIENPDALSSFNAEAKRYQITYESYESKTIFQDCERSLIVAKSPSVIPAVDVDSIDIATYYDDPICRVDTFLERWDWINQNVHSGNYPLSVSGITNLERPDETGVSRSVLMATVGNSVMIALLSEDEEHISTIEIYNLAKNTKDVVACGMIALGAASQMPDYLALVSEMIWHEHAYWDELWEMDPIESYHGVMFYVSETKILDDHYPTAVIVKDPIQK